MTTRTDLTGKQFQDLIVMRFVGYRNHNSEWEVQCKCGNVFNCLSGNLKKIQGCKECGRKRGAASNIENSGKKERAFKPGDKVGLLTLIQLGHIAENHLRYWLCRCDCGKEREFRETRLKAGSTNSCGCGPNARRFKHGLSAKGKEHEIYRLWVGMRQRCYNSSHMLFKYYGARGITVCSEWSDPDTGFQALYDWSISNGWQKGLSIDRIDTNGNYDPSNCRWATAVQQQRNRRNTVMVEHNGKLVPFAELLGGTNPQTYARDLHRLRNGWSIDRILYTPTRTRRTSS